MSDPTPEKMIPQSEVSQLMMTHRQGLQTTIRERDLEITILRAEILRLSGQSNTQATHPLVNLLFRTLIKEMTHE